jgi:hypothetical protein
LEKKGQKRKKERKREQEEYKKLRERTNQPDKQLSFGQQGQQGQQSHLALTTPLSFTYRLLISSLLKLSTASRVQLTPFHFSFSLPLFHFLPTG